MSKAEILAELPRLSPEDRREIVTTILDLDGSDPLSAEEIDLIEKRLDESERNPAAFVPWEEAEVRLRARLAR